MDVKYDDGRVDTEVTSINIQQCIAWTKKSQRGGVFGGSAEACGASL